MMKIAFFCCLLEFCFCFAVVESVPCESIGYHWSSPIGTHKRCYMDGITVIDSPGVSISSSFDASIGAMYLADNKKIKFLPVSPAEKFSNLVIYDAKNCSIETITIENFKALSKLIKLCLDNNKIEKVPSDVFEDLIALEFLWLEYNKIKFVNSAAFIGLSKLSDVDFRENVCIQGRYESSTSVATMIPTLTDKCGFSEDLRVKEKTHKIADEANNINESVVSNHKDQEQQGSTSNSLIRETKDEIVKSRNEIAKGFANIEAELKAAKVQIGELLAKLADLEKNEVRKETELKGLREQNRKWNDEVKVSLEMVKTQIQIEFSRLQASTSQTSTYQELNQCSAGKLALCEHELNHKQASNEMLQATVTELQISKAQMEGEVKTLNQQMEQRTLDLKSVQVENMKNLMKTDQQATTIASLITQTKVLSKDFKTKSDNFEECEREKANLDVDLKLSNSKLDVYQGIDIGKFREEIRTEFGLLRNTNNCGG